MAVNEVLRDWSSENGRYSVVTESYRFKAHVEDTNHKLTVKDIECRQERDLARLVAAIEELGNLHGVKKITVFIRSSMAPLFFDHGYRLEASIPKYYSDGQGMLIISKFKGSEIRQEALRPAGILIELGYGGLGVSRDQDLPSGSYLQVGRYEDIQGLEEIIDETDGKYALGRTWLAVVREKGDIVAAACLAADEQMNSAELIMLRGEKETEKSIYYSILVKALIQIASSEGIKCMYAVVDSKEMDLNQVLVERGFSYRGQLMADVVLGWERFERYVWSLNI